MARVNLFRAASGTMAAVAAAVLLMLAAQGGVAQIAPPPVEHEAAGANPGDIQGAVDAFRASLGGANNGVGGTFEDGRREINWDGVPDQFSAPNNLPPDFFNVNSPRGAVFSTPGSGFQVSANSVNPTNTPIEFGNIEPTYPLSFEPFSAQRLFTPLGSNVTDVLFFVPGTTQPALVDGFGAVFTDVDSATSTKIEYFGADNGLLFTQDVPNVPGSNETLSFAGASFDTARVARVRITSGSTALGPPDSLNDDIVVMDDFIYGEPKLDTPPPPPRPPPPPPSNATPLAANDSFKAKEDKKLKVSAPGVLSNDSDPDGDTLEASVSSGPKKGKLKLNPDGSFTYKPKKNFHGKDSFTYTVSDGKGGTDTATVKIKVKSRKD